MRHLDDLRAALIVVDPSDPYKWVSISGTTDITTEARVGRSTSSRRSTSARTRTRGRTRTSGD
jgi:hypothetical protein